MSEMQTSKPIEEPAEIGQCDCGAPRYQYRTRAYRAPVRCSAEGCGTELCGECKRECDFIDCETKWLCSKHATGIEGETYCDSHARQVFDEIVVRDREFYARREMQLPEVKSVKMPQRLSMNPGNRPPEAA